MHHRLEKESGFGAGGQEWEVATHQDIDGRVCEEESVVVGTNGGEGGMPLERKMPDPRCTKSKGDIVDGGLNTRGYGEQPGTTALRIHLR